MAREQFGVVLDLDRSCRLRCQSVLMVRTQCGQMLSIFGGFALRLDGFA